MLELPEITDIILSKEEDNSTLRQFCLHLGHLYFVTKALQDYFVSRADARALLVVVMERFASTASRLQADSQIVEKKCKNIFLEPLLSTFRAYVKII